MFLYLTVLVTDFYFFIVCIWLQNWVLEGYQSFMELSGSSWVILIKPWPEITHMDSSEKFSMGASIVVEGCVKSVS